MKKAGAVALALLVGAYLLIPVNSCGVSCPSCRSANQQVEQIGNTMPVCHQMAVASCHEEKPVNKGCNSQPGGTHPCCMKSVPSLADNFKFIHSFSNPNYQRIDAATHPAFVTKAFVRQITFQRASDHSPPEAFKADLYLLTSALLI